MLMHTALTHSPSASPPKARESHALIKIGSILYPEFSVIPE
jgi:hypothetical protein